MSSQTMQRCRHEGTRVTIETPDTKSGALSRFEFCSRCEDAIETHREEDKSETIKSLP